MSKKIDQKKFPVIINIFRKFKREGDNIIISAFCMTKGVGIKNMDIQKLKIFINKEYSIKFYSKKGIRFLAGFKFNIYKIKVPIEDIEKFDIQSRIDVKYENYDEGRIMFSVFDFKRGTFRNSRAIFINNKSIFLRQTIHNTTYLTIRDTNEYDYLKGRLKLLVGYILSKFTFKKNIIFLYEKECSRYEESASVLYEKLIDMGYNNAYFILNQNNPSYDKIKEKYKHNIIFKDSLKHIIYFFKARKFISSESIDHSLQLRSKNRILLRKIHSKNLEYVFLQHGVMYMVSLSSDLRSGFRKGEYKLHKIVVSSKLEAKHFTELANFDMEDLYVCGLLKFDRAVRNKNSDKIVIMPTWRRWEYNEATFDFENTKYFKMIKRILSSIPKKYEDKIVVLPHPLMADAIKNNDEFRKYILKDGITYDDVLKNCALLITDYSSIAYDAFYRGSNIIFYWEEKEECMEKYGSEAKLMITEETAFGDVVYNKEELKEIFDKNYMTKQQTKYKNRYKKIVEFSDNKNTDRLIKMLKKDKLI